MKHCVKLESTYKAISELAASTNHMITTSISFASCFAFRAFAYLLSLCPVSINIILGISTVIPYVPRESTALAKVFITHITMSFSAE
jgi:hypothetical protein